MSEDPGKEKEELLKGLEEAEWEAKRIEAATKDALQNARLVRDTAPQLRILYQEMPVSGLPPEESGAPEPEHAIVARRGEVNAADVHRCFDVQCDVVGGN